MAKIKMHRLSQEGDLLKKAEKLHLPEKCILDLIDGNWRTSFDFVRYPNERRFTLSLQTTMDILVDAGILERYEIDEEDYKGGC